MMGLKRSLYVFRDAARILYDLIRSILGSAKLKPLKSSSCIFKRNEIIVICYGDGLSVFAEGGQKIDELKNVLSIHFCY